MMNRATTRLLTLGLFSLIIKIQQFTYFASERH